MVGQVADRVTVDAKVRQAFAAPEFPELLVSDPEQPREFLLGDCGLGQRSHLDSLTASFWPSSEPRRWPTPLMTVGEKVRDDRRLPSQRGRWIAAVALVRLWWPTESCRCGYAQRSAGAPGGREGRATDSAVVRMNAVLRGGMGHAYPGVRPRREGAIASRARYMEQAKQSLAVQGGSCCSRGSTTILSAKLVSPPSASKLYA